ncbi:AI-2E family transporter [Aestuariivirga litoralis]|uniref:AI-2E family transporter n=1 Tax=Aestuariivirga litoralis TaxID=2650924 RepID=UPI0018C5DBE5|nr:AI-2E family transporter [Aestuariivirga litoralis]MBG1233477.1 AI-2E family transporter [Aestuariivirga litoralis]
MRAAVQTKYASLAHAVIIAAGLVGALYIGQDIIIPFVIAGILAVILLPLVGFLIAIHVPRILATLLAVCLALGVILATGSLMGRTAMDLVSDLPKYEQQLRAKAEALKSVTTSTTYDNAARMVKRLQEEISPTPPDANVQSAPAVIAGSEDGLGLTVVKSTLRTLAHPFLQLATIFVLLLFMLFYHEEMRDRLILLIGTRRSALALNESARRLSRLMLGVLSLNLLVGTVIGAALWFLGIPGAIMWGVLTALLRFVPFLGTFIASAFPILTALAVGDGWGLAVTVATIIAVTEFTAAQIIEPVILGKMSGLWPPALIVAALFWVAIWGPIGLIVSTPITICLLAFSQHIRSWRAVASLLGEAPVLAPEDAFHGRLIVGDVAGLATMANAAITEGNAETFLDALVIPALQRISRDMDDGEMSRAQLEEVKDTLEEMLEAVIPEEETETTQPRPVLIIASHGALNHCAALSFAALLRSKTIASEVVRFGDASRALEQQPKSNAGAPVILASLFSFDDRLTLHLSKKLKSKYPGTEVLITAWLRDAKTPQFKSPALVAENLRDRSPPKARRKPPAAERTTFIPA